MKSIRKINDPFLYNIPCLDLHGETYESSGILTKEFINDNVKLDNRKIVIIHGKGLGIVKSSVYQELKQNKNVRDYKSDYFNEGMTIINLK